MGLTYFKVKSPYAGDLTKFCSLNGIEIDNNFLTLEGLDLVDVQFDGEDLIFILKNGRRFRCSIATSSSTALKNYHELDNSSPDNTVLPCTIVSGVNHTYSYVEVNQADYDGITFNVLPSEPSVVNSASHLFVTYGDKFYRRVDYADGDIFILNETTDPLIPAIDKFYYVDGIFYQYFPDVANNFYYGQAILTDGIKFSTAFEMLEHLAYDVDAGTYTN